MRLTGKVALVTGASGGVGAAIAHRLAAEGATVIGTYVGDVGMAEEAINHIAKAGNSVHLMHLDQRCAEAIEHAADFIKTDHARLDILVNNAAWNLGIPFANLDALTPELWDRIVETNLRGPFLLARACAPLLRANGTGHIVNVSSVGGMLPIGSSIAYASSKAGLNHLTRCLAVAMAPDVAVNCIALGLVENTNMANRAMDSATQQATREKVLLRRNVQLKDVGDQVMTFIVSTSITGQVIAIDGGMLGAMC